MMNFDHNVKTCDITCDMTSHHMTPQDTSLQVTAYWICGQDYCQVSPLCHHLSKCQHHLEHSQALKGMYHDENQFSIHVIIVHCCSVHCLSVHFLVSSV